ncbi:MAG: ABC transporter permease [Deltaproteobacteria bacterium]|nr:ABC transporter permease [Deltaproteobacteria bacterium]
MFQKITGVVKDYYVAILSFLVIIILWQVLVTVFRVPDYLLPTPWVILKGLKADLGLFSPHIRMTLIEILVGYVLAVVLSIILALGVTYSKFLEKLIYPYLLTFQTVPKIAIAPVFVVWFGIGLLPRLIIVLLISFFSITINTIAGFNAMSREYSELMKSVSATELQTFVKIRFPYALPYIFSGLKIGATNAVIGAIIAEWIASGSGIGYILNIANSELRTDRAFEAILVLVVIGILFFLLIALLEKYISWQKTEVTEAVTKM